MRLYTFSDARQNFAAVLNAARSAGKVLIRRRDGSLFSLIPEKSLTSPLDIKGIKTKVSTLEAVDILREERGRTRRVEPTPNRAAHPRAGTKKGDQES